jgi:hypothetical protein
MAKMSLFIILQKDFVLVTRGLFFWLQGCEISPPKKSLIPTKDQFIFKSPKTCIMGNPKIRGSIVDYPTQIVTFQWKKEIKNLKP